MNKEEIEKAFVEAKKELEMPREELLNKLWDVQQEHQQLKKEYNKVVHKATEFESNVYELQQENKKYKEVIDKAIKFIDNYMYENYCYVGSEDRLKDILKEVE